MVQTSLTFVLATIAISAASSAIAFPLSQNSQQDARELLLERSFWNTLKKDFGKVVSVAAPIVSKFIREDEMELSARELERNGWQLPAGVHVHPAGLQQPLPVKASFPRPFGLSARELEERSFWNTLKKDFGKVVSVAAPIVSKFIRDDEMELFERELTLEERSFWNTLKKDFGKVVSVAAPIVSKFIREDEMELFERELEERSFWNTLKKDFGKVVSVAAPIVSKFIREDETELFGRDLSLEERSFWNTLKKDFGKVVSVAAPIVSKFIREEEMELFGRDLSLEERSFWNTLKKDFGKVASFAAPIVSKFIREDEYDLAAREYDDLVIREDEMELFGRELTLEERSFWNTLKKDFGKVASFAAPIVSKFIREEEYDLAARDYDDLVYGREYLDINELD